MSVTAVIFGVLLLSGGAANQDQTRLLEEERRRQMDVRPREGEDGDRQSLLWDAGGWFHGELVTLDDPPEKPERTLRYADLRLWGELRYEQAYTAYARVLTDYLDFNSGHQFEGSDDNRFRPFYVDQAWLRADGSTPDRDLIVQAGRQYMSVGRGLLLNQVAYGATAEWAAGRWGVRGQLAHTIVHDDDIDPSRPDADDSRRGFGSLELNYVLHAYHRLFLIGMLQMDLDDQEQAGQRWQYDSRYLGAGLRGAFGQDLGYHLEAVLETGESSAAGSTETEAIRAWALTFQAEYRFRVETSPTLLFEYMFGSGDDDRGSVTEAASGNEAGTRDEGFLGFGFLQTGYALFPRVSNIHIVRLGGWFAPLESRETFRALQVGLFYYLYRKDESAAPISDPRSFKDDSDVGQEVDVTLRWRIFSDLGVSVNFGRFLPGDAYDETSGRTFLSAGFTYGF